MFKNPLKFQQGGNVPTEEQQQMLAAFIEWLPKRVKEFQGMQPEAIAQALDGMSKSPEGAEQVQQLMEQFQQEMKSGAQSFRNGGKIHDFICKHGKGGNIKNCGCGGNVKKGQEGLVTENPLTRRQALDLGIRNNGYSNSQARFAYQNAKQALRNNNATIENPEERLRGRTLRQRAREMVAGNNTNPIVSQPSNETSIFAGLINKYGNQLSQGDLKWLQDLKQHSDKMKETDYAEIPDWIRLPEHNNQSNLSFNDAFGKARAAGANTFYWNGNPYTTELASSQPSTNTSTNNWNPAERGSQTNDIPSINPGVISFGDMSWTGLGNGLVNKIKEIGWGGNEAMAENTKNALDVAFPFIAPARWLVNKIRNKTE